MPEGDRRIVIGFGCLIILLVIGGLWHVSSYNQNQREHREKAASYEAYDNQDIAECSAMLTDFDRLACLMEKVGANQEQERGRADLHAQQDMASWAVALLWASGIGIIVSVGGIVLIYATLLETRAMTVATREIGEKQSRAYVNASSVEAKHIKLTELLNTTEIYISLKNTGQTPANDIVIGGEAIIYEKSFTVLGSDREICRQSISPESVVDLPPDGKPQRVELQLDKQFVKTLREQGMNALASTYLRIEGDIKYWDVFEGRYLTQFIFESTIFKGVPFEGMARSSEPVACYKKIESRKP